MPMPAPFFDSGWNYVSGERDKTVAPSGDRSKKNDNSAVRVAWELGLVLLVPLAGAGLVEMVLTALHIY